MDTEEPVLLEPEGGVQNEEHGAMSLQEGVSTDIATVEEKNHEEQAVEVEKTILEEPEAMKEATPAPEPQLQEEKTQSSAVAETEAKSQENAAQHSTHAQAQHAHSTHRHMHTARQHAHSEREKNLRAKEDKQLKLSICGVGVVVFAKHFSSAPKQESSSTVELQIGGVVAPE
jgi:hypothetical protein